VSIHSGSYGAVAIDRLALYRCLAAGATGDLATHRPWTTTNALREVPGGLENADLISARKDFFQLLNIF